VISALLAAPPSALDPHGSEARDLANVWWIIFAIAIGVYLVVGGLIVFSLVRGRRQDPADASTKYDNRFIWIGGVIVPSLILLFMAFLTVHTGGALRAPSRGELHVEVTGEDWWWAVRYPGTSVVTANEIHLPVGQPISIGLESDNVIHSFWVPQLAGKEDLIPGQRNTLRFTIQRAGTYRGQCAEYCGIQHARMGLRVVAQSPGNYAKWLAHEQQLQSLPSSDLEARGELAFTTNACAGCHTIRGTDANGRKGPDLTDVGGRATLGAETLLNTKKNMDAWITNPGHFKPGVLMPPATISPSDIAAIVSYLEARR
jgi:cytochrome c oxidase subunit II